MKKFFVPFWAAVGLLAGAQSLELTPDSAVKLALDKNLGIQTEVSKVSVKQRERDFVWNKFLPSMSVSATLSRSNTEITASGLVPFGTGVTIPGVGTTYDTVLAFSREVNPVNLSTGLQLQLPLNLALFRGIEQTLLDFDAARLSLDAARVRLERDVRKTYASLLAMKEALGLTERQMESARQRYLQTQASFRSGLVPELSVLQAQVAWENKKPALEDQRVGYTQALLGFKSLLGVDIGLEVSLTGEISVPDSEFAAKDAELLEYLGRRADLKVLQAQKASVENLVRVQQDSLWPTLVLMASMDPSLNAPLDSASWESWDNWSQRAGMVGLSLSWKLDSMIPGSPFWVQVENTKAQAQQLDLAYRQSLNQAAVEVRVLIQRIRKSTTSLKTLDLSVALARRAFQMSEAAYRSGSQSLLEVQEAEIQLQGALLQVLNEKLTLSNSLLDLETALGTPRSEIFQERKE